MKNSKLFIIPLLCVAVLFTMFAGCVVGTADISLAKAFRIFLSLITGEKSPEINESSYYIILHLRLPRVLLAAITGAGLSVCGVAFQAIFRNPLSDPYVLGVSSGASLGATVAIICGLDAAFWGVSILSFVTALLTVLLIIGIASMGNRLHTTTLLLAGISINFLIASLISLLMLLNQQDMDRIIFWTMGSLSSANYENVIISAFFVIIGITVISIYSRDLNAMLLGSQTAQNVGVNVEKTKKVILLFSTLMIAVIVSFSGVIGFIGLVVPHIVRLAVGTDNRKILPYSILVGILFMVVADIISRIAISPTELPVGSITSLTGAPVFIYLLFNAKKKLRG
ncbi:MAG: iron ABC transporter permease [Bacteroidales bacterium]|jgi:iron complex transport system permease protein|nr:iron ABC transporter permease [Bacteroidales bacterium]